MSNLHHGPKIRSLTNKETIASLEGWKASVLYGLRLNPEFRPYLRQGFEFGRKSRANPYRSLTPDIQVTRAEDTDDDDIIRDIKQKYPNCEVDMFQKNGKFSGTIKIIFQGAQELEDALKERIMIQDVRYIIGKYIYKPRVVVCKYCQTIGHISRLCRNRERNKHVCGKCSSKSHETKDCTVQPEDYKCYHCEGKHITGSKVCRIMIQKMEELTARHHNG